MATAAAPLLLTLLLASKKGAASPDAAPSHSVSGVSAGGSMAAQHLVAFSSKVIGAGIVAGSPYGCGRLPSFASCSTNQPPINLQTLFEYTAARESAGLIDELVNLRSMPLYMYSGKKDTVVYQAEMDRTLQYFKRYINSSSIEVVYNVSSEHGYITDGYGECCDCEQGTFILNCQYDQAGAILQRIYGPLRPKTAAKQENMRLVNQEKYTPPAYTFAKLLMAMQGLIYVPTLCAANVSSCRVHINYHGCGGTAPRTTIPEHTGFNEWAEANNIIILYPQVGYISEDGCYDWTGKTGPKFDTKEGGQLQLVMRMLADLPNALVPGPAPHDDDDEAAAEGAETSGLAPGYL